MQIAQDISSRMHDKKRRRSGLRRGFLACIIGEIAKSRCVSYFSTVPKYNCSAFPVRWQTLGNLLGCIHNTLKVLFHRFFVLCVL